MKQLIQNFKTGKLTVDEVAAPTLAEGQVLVSNRFSLISQGTERNTVKVAKASLIGKAKQRPDLVAQVIQNVKKEGLKATIDKVRTKLDSPKALGYSCAGVVAASLDTNNRYKTGDRVACAGQDFASHAEVVSVPQNLVAKIPDNVTFEQASYTTLGAIALQGVRQAEPRIGESVLVIGLGLLGQLTAQILRANGCRVFGTDFSEKLLQLAEETGIEKAMDRNHPDMVSEAMAFSSGHGFDSIIITAATDSNDPIELSAELARHKAKIVVVGAVSMNVPRDPHFYRKELDLRMACSYGPGRYDPSYEIHGIDYHIGHVRWTEQRNMEAFLQLLSKGDVNVDILTTHTFDISDATQAYDIVLNDSEPAVGMLLQYHETDSSLDTKVVFSSKPVEGTAVGMIGAGSFGQSYLLPPIVAQGWNLGTVVTSKGLTANSVAEKFGFAQASTDANDVFQDEKINPVFIATRHNTHHEFVIQSLQASKAVFVEKPLAIDMAGLQAVKEAYDSQDSPTLMVGFNRRFSQAAQLVQNEFGDGSNPLVMNFRINAGPIDAESWIQDAKIGGGRLVGEVCHFVDLMQFFSNSNPTKVFATCLKSEGKNYTNQDNLLVTLEFENGHIGTIAYVANGDKSLEKEKVEVFGGGKVVVIDDFKSVTIHAGGKSKVVKTSGKGHKEEVQSFLSSVRQGRQAPIEFTSLYATTLCTLLALDSLATGLPQEIPSI